MKAKAKARRPAAAGAGAAIALAALLLLSALSAFSVFAAAAGTQVLKPAPGPALDLKSFLPAAGIVKGWEAAGEPQVYKGADLFLYIDGGAEIFHEYGFRQVLTQEYKRPGGGTLSLEIYEMADASAAFGMFTFKSSRQGRPIDIGQGGRVEDYYLNFWKGPCLVTITELEKSPESLAGLVRLARAVGARIGLAGDRPAIVDALPKAWTEGARVVYLRGFIGLNNIRVLYPSDIFLFREAVAAEGKDFLAFVFGYTNAAEAEGRLTAIRKAFASSPLYKAVGTVENGRFEANDSKGGRIAVRLMGNRIGLARTEPSGSPSSLLDQLK